MVWEGNEGVTRCFGDLTEACAVSGMLASGQVFLRVEIIFCQKSCVDDDL